MRRLLAAFLFLVSPGVVGHEFLLEDLQIIHPAIPATPMESTTAHIYMALVNDGTEPERLLAIETQFGKAVLERTVTAPDGSTQIQKMAWIDIPPGDTVLLTQGEMRGRVEGVSQPLFEGGQLDGTFVFEKRGRFKMFFLVDPIEAVEEKPVATVSDDVDRAKSTTEIAATLRGELGADAAILPLAIVGDVAIVGWTHGKDAARAFLRRRNESWQVIMWSGPSLMLPSTLTSLGIGTATAARLRDETSASEGALGPSFVDRFDAYPGTVVLQ